MPTKINTPQFQTRHTFPPGFETTEYLDIIGGPDDLIGDEWDLIGLSRITQDDWGYIDRFDFNRTD